MFNKLFFFILFIFLPINCYAQNDDFYIKNAAGGSIIYYVSFSELLTYPKKLDGKNVFIFGFCARIFKEDKDIYIFSSEQAADHIVVREAVALRYEKKKSDLSFSSESEYVGKISVLDNNFCSVQGRYSLIGDSVLGVSTHGTLYVNSIDKGMMREDSVRKK